MENIIKDKNTISIESDVVLFHDYILCKDKYFLSSEKKNVYLKINKDEYTFLKLIIPYMDGTRNITQIEKEIYDNTGKKLDISQLINFLYKFSLLKNSDAKNKSKVELDLYSKKLHVINVGKIQKEKSYIMNIILICIMILFFAVILLNISNIVVGKNIIVINDISSTGVFGDKQGFCKMFFIFIFSYSCMFIHELGHILVANYYNIKIRNVNIIMKMGIIPGFYINYENLYSIRSSVKIRVLLAGVFFDFIQANLFFLLFNLTKNGTYYIFVHISLLNIIRNLSPMNVSDGYHVFTTLFGIEGLRWNIINIIKKIINKELGIKSLVSKKNIIYTIYFISSYLIMLKSIFMLFNSITSYFNLNALLSIIIKIIILSIFLGNIMYFSYVFVQKLKNDKK